MGFEGVAGMRRTEDGLISVTRRIMPMPPNFSFAPGKPATFRGEISGGFILLLLTKYGNACRCSLLGHLRAIFLVDYGVQ